MMRRILEESLGRSVVKNHQPLSFDFVPKELPHREEQFREVTRIFKPLATDGLAQNVRFQGPVGTGKTVTAKRFSQELRDFAREQNRSVDFVVVNCRRRQADGAVLLHIIRHFDEGFPDRGFSVSEMLTILQKHLVKHAVNLIIVLDEADVLLRHAKSDLIYQLTRFNEEAKLNWSVSLILISQRPLTPLLDEASASTLKHSNVVDFRKYAANELADIVAQRVEMAFHPNAVAKDVVELIAKIASKKGDARYAIEILGRSAGLADNQKSDSLTQEHVRAANAATYATVERDKIEELSRSLKITLLAVARALKKKTEISTGDLAKVYAVVCEEYAEKPRGSTQFWKYLKELEARGLLEQDVGRSGAGNTTLVSLHEVEAADLETFVVESLAAQPEAGLSPEEEPSA
jgi:cell division control protein 6